MDHVGLDREALEKELREVAATAAAFIAYTIVKDALIAGSAREAEYLEWGEFCKAISERRREY